MNVKRSLPDGRSEVDLAREILVEVVDLLREGSAHDVSVAESYEKEAVLLRRVAESKLEIVGRFKELSAMLGVLIATH